MTHPTLSVHRRRSTAPSRWLGMAVGLVCGGLVCGGLVTAPTPAHAWDPSTTHLGIVDRAAHESAVHLRWMASSELQRGLFTPLRVDPALLQADERRLFTTALARVPSGSGVEPLGGPGACPGDKAPAATQLYCVAGDTWEMLAIQWLQFGVLAELSPSARAVHHFVDRRDPTRLEFSDPQRPLLLRSRQVRHNGAPLAGYITGSSFAGTGASAIAWLDDANDPLAPARLFHHLELAATHPEPRTRDHHLAMALVGLGAVMHVLQDMAVPAHARGDVSAFFLRLSNSAGDRGLPFNEHARLAFGRHGLPGARDPEAVASTRGHALVAGLRAHFLGDGAAEGLAVVTGRRFFSERSVPQPRALDPDATPEAAAAALLVDTDLDPGELAGAVLSPWPADRGYIKTVTGRPLAAFDTDDHGVTHAYIDEAVYREQFAQLLPRAVDATRSLLDWMWPTWPELTYDAKAGHLDFFVAADWTNPELLVFTQTPEGQRTISQKIRLQPGKRNRAANLPPVVEDQRRVVVLRARRSTGEPLILEHVLGPDSQVIGIVPAPYVPPEPEPDPEPAPAPEPEPEPVSPDDDDDAASDDEAAEAKDDDGPATFELTPPTMPSRPTRRTLPDETTPTP